MSLVTHGKFRDAAVVETQVEESRVLGFAPASEADVVQTGNRGSELAVSRRVTSSFVDENAVEGDGDVVVGGEVTACVLNRRRSPKVAISSAPLKEKENRKVEVVVFLFDNYKLRSVNSRVGHTRGITQVID